MKLSREMRDALDRAMRVTDKLYTAMLHGRNDLARLALKKEGERMEAYRAAWLAMGAAAKAR
jgi:hypothetical protein